MQTRVEKEERAGKNGKADKPGAGGGGKSPTSKASKEEKESGSQEPSRCSTLHAKMVRCGRRRGSVSAAAATT